MKEVHAILSHQSKFTDQTHPLDFTCSYFYRMKFKTSRAVDEKKGLIPPLQNQLNNTDYLHSGK